MAMTSRDFEAIAAKFHDMPEWYNRDMVAACMMDLFTDLNKNFNKDRFKAAMGGDFNVTVKRQGKMDP